MTDNEIIKVNDILDKFDFFNQPAGYEHWVGMPEGIKRKAIEDKENDIKFLKDFINRQQAEIERLSLIVKDLGKAGVSVDKLIMIKDAKAEAIREFAERLHDLIHSDWQKIHQQIDNLVKEIIGE